MTTTAHPMMTDAMRAMVRSRTAMVLDAAPFWATLSLRLTLVESTTVPTAATDGTRMLFNPDFVLSLSEAQRQGLIAHETAHCALGHPWRRGSRDPKRANVAMDYVINPLLVAAGFTLPEGALLDPQWTGHSFEWVYDRLPAQDPDQDSDSGDQQPGTGGVDVMDAPPAPQDTSDEPGDQDQGTGGGADQDQQNTTQQPPQGPPDLTEADWAQAVTSVAATVEAQGRGTSAAGQARDAAGQCKRREDWRGVLQRWAQERAAKDYSWSHPSHRYRHLGVILPSLHSPTVGALLVAIDTSGSVDAAMLSIMQEQVRAIADDIQPSAIHVVYCDADVQGVETFANGDPVDLTLRGGGGTDFRPVFDLLASETLDPAPIGVVYMTDLDGTFPRVAPEVPVLWAVPETPYTSARGGRDGLQSRVPFGDVLEISA